MKPRRITLLARHYPPAVSGGARRPFLLAQALRAEGVEVHVVAPSLPEGEPGIAVPHPHRDPSTAPPRAPSWRDHARELLLWPDPDIRWAMCAARAAAALPTPDWIITTSPPESLHAAGAWLRRRTGARWAMDFRDHWLERPHRQERSRWWRKAGEAMLARRWLARADLIVAVDPVIATELAALGARAARVITHVAAPPPPPAPLPSDSINVVHTGAIALSDPDCRVADMLDPFVAALAVNPTLRLHLAGRLTDGERATLAASPAAARWVDHGVLTLDAARALQAGADALIFVASPKMHVPPSKITEYLTCDVPIIACGAGPWRADPRTPPGDPTDALANLRKGMHAPTERIRPPTPSVAARALLDLMAEVSR